MHSKEIILALKIGAKIGLFLKRENYLPSFLIRLKFTEFTDY